MVCNLDLSGWKGKVARQLPDSLWRRLLIQSHSRLRENSTPVAYVQVRNRERSRSVAKKLGIDFLSDQYDLTTRIRRADWRKLAENLKQQGFRITRCDRDSTGYGSLSVWSVRQDPTQTFAKNALQGAGALWSVHSDNSPLLPDIQDFVGPIDVVYTWVDASDPLWRQKYRHYKDRIPCEGIDASSRDLARYTSRDELKYSLRSLQLNLPWVRKIFIVTADQVPTWLDTSHPQIQVVSHDEIFEDPVGCLPTFNSHAIESQISRIPGLSEYFLYVNDDVFFGKPLSPNSFYSGSGTVKYSLARAHFSEAVNGKLPVNRAARRNGTLIQEKYGRTTALKFRHVAHPQRLSVHKKIFDDFSDEIRATARQRFRHPMDISVPSSLAHYVAAAEGVGIPIETSYAYIDLGGENLGMNLFRLLSGERRQMFCLNEISRAKDHASRTKLVQQFLSIFYPVRSSFEKA